MEDTLRVSRIFLKQIMLIVLILVLMEDTLRGSTNSYVGIELEVLILVLMEDTLRVVLSLSQCLTNQMS